MEEVVEEVVEVRLGTQGRIVLPRELRERLGAEAGSVYTARVEDGALILEPRDAVLRRLRQQVRDVEGARRGSVVDELATERRREAARDSR